MYKVLHVDSDAHSSEATERMLDWALLGFDIKARAAHSAEARTLFNEHQFSLVLINIKRSHPEGLQLCEEIRQMNQVPIILLGGSDDFDLARKALKYRVNDYLAEPVQSSDLTSSLLAVKQELDRRTALDPSLMSTKLNQHAAQTSIIDIVKRYVQEDLRRNVTLKKISDSLHFNCAYLGQKFKCTENMSFNEYLLQQRMEKAKQLLIQTDMKIYEIAGEVGYTEIDWFYKKFKEYAGISANEYRKQVFVSA